MKLKPTWGLLGLAVVAVAAYVMYTRSPVVNGCLKSQYYCPGVGCVSGPDKCTPGAAGGPSKVFSRETFSQWPGTGVSAVPPTYEAGKETFVSKKCLDGTRSDGPCLMEF